MSDLWDKKNPPSAANQACAHLHVEYFTRLRDDGSTDGWWACRDCGTNFIPIAHARQQVEAALERAAKEMDEKAKIAQIRYDQLAGVQPESGLYAARIKAFKEGAAAIRVLK